MVKEILGYEKIRDIPEEELMYLTTNYAYSPLLQFLYSRYLKEKNDHRYPASVAKTALYFSNPHWLHHQLQKRHLDWIELEIGNGEMPAERTISEPVTPSALADPEEDFQYSEVLLSSTAESDFSQDEEIKLQEIDPQIEIDAFIEEPAVSSYSNLPLKVENQTEILTESAENEFLRENSHDEIAGEQVSGSDENTFNAENNEFQKEVTSEEIDPLAEEITGVDGVSWETDQLQSSDQAVIEAIVQIPVSDPEVFKADIEENLSVSSENVQIPAEETIVFPEFDDVEEPTPVFGQDPGDTSEIPNDFANVQEEIKEPEIPIEKPVDSVEEKIDSQVSETQDKTTLSELPLSKTITPYSWLQPKEPSELNFEPVYAIDYFASQGIKLTPEEETRDQLSNKLKSFTEWLKSMKKIHPEKLFNELDEKTELTIKTVAEHSNEKGEILTETMAEIFLKQGLIEKSLEVYEKLSLLNPSKSDYFAAKISALKAIGI